MPRYNICISNRSKLRVERVKDRPNPKNIYDFWDYNPKS